MCILLQMAGAIGNTHILIVSDIYNHAGVQYHAPSFASRQRCNRNCRDVVDESYVASSHRDIRLAGCTQDDTTDTCLHILVEGECDRHRERGNHNQVHRRE